MFFLLSRKFLIRSTKFVLRSAIALPDFAASCRTDGGNKDSDPAVTGVTPNRFGTDSGAGGTTACSLCKSISASFSCSKLE